MALVLGVDLGTSGVRVLAVDEAGALVTERTRGYPLLTPRPGWTEQRPEDWLEATFGAIQDVMDELAGQEIVALGLSGQMHGMVPLDAQGAVIRPAILWNDQRTGEAVRVLEESVPRATLIARGGNPAITGFQLPKVLWLRDAEPENFARLRHVLLPKDYLGYALTGQMVAEPSDASGTNCFVLETKTWDDEVLSAVGLTASLYPEVIPSHGVVGKVTQEVAARTGLPEGLPVVAGAGDNAAAAIGLGLGSHEPGLGSVSLGTSGVIFAPLAQPTPDPEGRVHLFCHADGGYHLLGVTLSSAGSLQWYRDVFAPDVAFADLVARAEASMPGAGGVTFKPYLAGERTPHLDPDLRGSWTGLSLATTQADIVRAVLEGVAFSLGDALEVITPLAPLGRALTTGGGARSDFWLQLVTDVLGVKLERLSQNQGAAYGAALLAWQGIGHAERATDLAQRVVGSSFMPNAPSAYDEALHRYRKVSV